MNVFCTVVTRSHLPQARALAESLTAAGNSEPVHVLLADSGPEPLPADEGALRFHAFDEIAAELPPLIRHYFDAFELSNALKPFLVALLFRRGAERVVYLDADLHVAGSFAPVWNGFGAASLQLTPHLLAPPGVEAPWINEVEIVDMGFLNGGFAAWRAGPAAARLLDWLCSVLPVRGFCDRSRGMFVDQKLLPLLLQYFPADVLVSRDPALNIAFWNAHERPVRREADGRWTLHGEPVVFFHLSGYRLAEPGKACAYLSAADNAAILRRSPWLAKVMAEYHARFSRHAAAQPSAPYAFASYCGVELTRGYRELLFRTGALDRSDAAFWRLFAVERLRKLKRGLKGLLP